MRWAITGTPGTGKTTVTNRLELDRPLIHLNEVIDEHDFSTGTDPKRGSQIADIDAVREWAEKQPSDAVFESHLSHLLPVDRVIVLRCAPDELSVRLEERTEDHHQEFIKENVESERYDIVLVEAIKHHGEENVYELDTTGRSPESITNEIKQVLTGEFQSRVGIVSFLEEE